MPKVVGAMIAERRQRKLLESGGIAVSKMELTEFDYARDAVAMAVHDCLPRETVFSALQLSENAAQFNWAVWASCHLSAIVENADA